MLMTTDSTVQGYRYQVIRKVVGGCYPFEKAHEYARLEMEFQAAFWDANAVIGIQTIQDDRFYVLVSGTAIWIYDPPYHTLPPTQEEGSCVTGRFWGYVWEWAKQKHS